MFALPIDGDENIVYEEEDDEGTSLAAQYLSTLSAVEASALLMGAPDETRVSPYWRILWGQENTCPLMKGFHPVASIMCMSACLLLSQNLVARELATLPPSSSPEFTLSRDGHESGQSSLIRRGPDGSEVCGRIGFV